MKRLLALVILAFTFSISSFAQGFAAPVKEATPLKPEEAMEAQLKGSKDTVDGDKSEAKLKKAKTSKRKSSKKSKKKADVKEEAPAKEETK
jgi:hypothetical protein